ncbi:hypothetical protein H5J25_13850 [Sphingomonas aliaeris]|uniref:DUF3168 domain-containing protein n=1 Tax=Sphingomonas aliaeris TaxID=2759526 RepID=A0A974S3G5_9SPHN|nr:hypothetical protein [Sphingomonas aliaeris]QQV76527.1 hypothetical protein H5J25_13850 [Sphingomonas aliaeris]
MTGDEIVGTMLRECASLTALVEAQNIMLDELPDSATIPNLLVTSVSSVDRQQLERGSSVRVTERVAVKVRANNSQERREIIRLVRKCCAGMIGAIGGGANVAILTAGQGPNLRGPGNSFERTQDFRVSFDDPT